MPPTVRSTRRARPTSARRSRRVLALAALALGAACADHDPIAPGGGGTPPPGGPAPLPPVVTDPGTPTSFDLIAAAERAGTLSSEQALLERVWAATGDARLASRFRDPHATTRRDVPVRLTQALREAAERLPTVSAATQRELVPYFQPPAYEGSAWTRPRSPAGAASARASASRAAAEAVPGPRPIPAEGWSHMDVPGLPVRIWRHPEFSRSFGEVFGEPSTSFWDVTEAGIVAELQKSWPKLTALMGRPPVPDGGPHEFELIDGTPTTWGDGGSPALDIYLVSPGALGVHRTGGAATMAYPPGCSARPAFMLLSPFFNADHKLGPIIAHELFHAIQFAFAREVDCADQWDESTAEWAGYYVYPRWGADPMDPLIQTPRMAIGSSIGYWEWTFNAYLQHAHSPTLVRATYEKYAAAPTAMHALDLALPGGLRRHLKEYARHAYNQEPAGASFRGWEGITSVPDAGDPPVRSLELADGERRHEWDLGAPPQPRSRYYRRYGVPRGGTTAAGAQGDTVRYLEFTNPHAGAAKASVQAYVKPKDGAWRLEDWSNRSRITFCYDTPAERVDSLLVIISDHRLPDAGEEPLPTGEVEIRDACPQDPREYVIQARYWTTSEKFGIDAEVSYAARVVETEAGSGELTGSGSYRGTINRQYPANCHHLEPGDWPKAAVSVSGALEATAFLVAHPEQPKTQDWFGFSLVTTDWTWMPIHERHASTEEEREAAAGMGTVTTGLDLLTLVGGSLEETTVRGTSTASAECAGLVTHHRQVSITRMR